MDQYSIGGGLERQLTYTANISGLRKFKSACETLKENPVEEHREHVERRLRTILPNAESLWLDEYMMTGAPEDNVLLCESAQFLETVRNGVRDELTEALDEVISFGENTLKTFNGMKRTFSHILSRITHLGSVQEIADILELRENETLYIEEATKKKLFGLLAQGFYPEPLDAPFTTSEFIAKLNDALEVRGLRNAYFGPFTSTLIKDIKKRRRAYDEVSASLVLSCVRTPIQLERYLAQAGEEDCPLDPDHPLFTGIMATYSEKTLLHYLDNTEEDPFYFNPSSYPELRTAWFFCRLKQGFYSPFSLLNSLNPLSGKNRRKVIRKIRHSLPHSASLGKITDLLPPSFFDSFTLLIDSLNLSELEDAKTQLAPLLKKLSKTPKEDALVEELIQWVSSFIHEDDLALFAKAFTRYKLIDSKTREHMDPSLLTNVSSPDLLSRVEVITILKTGSCAPGDFYYLLKVLEYRIEKYLPSPDTPEIIENSEENETPSTPLPSFEELLQDFQRLTQELSKEEPKK